MRPAVLGHFHHQHETRGSRVKATNRFDNNKNKEYQSLINIYQNGRYISWFDLITDILISVYMSADQV